MKTLFCLIQQEVCLSMWLLNREFSREHSMCELMILIHKSELLDMTHKPVCDSNVLFSFE